MTEMTVLNGVAIEELLTIPMAVEAVEPDGQRLYYTWADLDHGSASIANLLGALNLPEGNYRLERG